MGRCKVSWFKRKKDEYEIVTSQIPMTTVYRWYIYDTVPDANANEIAVSLGLNPISPEGEAKEREDSEERLLQVQELFPFVETISELSAKVMTSMHLKELDGIDSEDKDIILQNVDSMASVYKAIAFSTLIGAFSIGINLGMIEQNAFNLDTFYLGDEDE